MFPEFEWSNRKFHAHFGICKEITSILWLYLKSLDVPFTFEPMHLLWALYFIKVYSSIDVCSSYWKVSPPTYSLWIWRVLHVLSQMDTVY